MSIEIINKLSKALKAPKDSLLIGDVRSQMAADLLKNLTTVIERKAKHPRPYFILVSAKADPAYPGGNVIKERLILLDERPKTKFVGTILIRVDNKNADATIEWVLPLDIPSILPVSAGRRGDLKPGEASIMDSARGVPIFHGSLN